MHYQSFVHTRQSLIINPGLICIREIIDDLLTTEIKFSFSNCDNLLSCTGCNSLGYSFGIFFWRSKNLSELPFFQEVNIFLADYCSEREMRKHI